MIEFMKEYFSDPLRSTVPLLSMGRVPLRHLPRKHGICQDVHSILWVEWRFGMGTVGSGMKNKFLHFASTLLLHFTRKKNEFSILKALLAICENTGAELYLFDPYDDFLQPFARSRSTSPTIDRWVNIESWHTTRQLDRRSREKESE